MYKKCTTSDSLSFNFEVMAERATRSNGKQTQKAGKGHRRMEALKLPIQHYLRVRLNLALNQSCHKIFLKFFLGKLNKRTKSSILKRNFAEEDS